jgi:hypothetical protein
MGIVAGVEAELAFELGQGHAIALEVEVLRKSLSGQSDERQQEEKPERLAHKLSRRRM